MAEAREDGAEDGGGDGEAEPGKGIWEGVRGVESSASTRADTAVFFVSRLGGFTGFAFAFESGFLDTGEEGKDASGAGSSTMLGRPECGPLRFLMEEKCSQSW